MLQRDSVMQPIISVIICTHNPRCNYLSRVLHALDSQTLSKDQWELMLIDNASTQILASEIDLSWHPQSRHIREETLGLTPARLRGIKESSGKLLVFVDDDNILTNDYLEESLHILDTYPFLGAFGGSVIAETESPLEAWQQPYLSFLAVREVTKPVWGNISLYDQNVPYGAGMCIRRQVAYHYYDLVQNDPLRMQLDRRGNLLSSAGDNDLALTAHDYGYATGMFPSLKLTHIIPKHRLEVEYLLRLKREGGASGFILDYIRNGKIPYIQRKIISRLLWKIRLIKCSTIERKMILAEEDARNLALAEIRKLQKGNLQDLK